MSLFLFLAPGGGFAGWIRAGEGGGAGLERPRPGEKIAAVVPGEEVSLRWLDLDAGITPAQAAGAARLLLAEGSAQPVGELHVAVGRAEADGKRRAATVPVAAMERWLAALAAEGLDPDHIVPDLLLLAPPEEGFARFDRDDGMSLYRAREEAFALEPDVAELVLGERPVTPVGEEALLLALPPLLDLRQGAFARRRQWQWKLDRARARRLALIGLGILLVTLALQLVSIMRHTFAADALEAETRKVATAALPRAPGIGDAGADLRRRLAELRGGGAGYGATAGAVFAAVRATPNVELSALSFGEDGNLRLSVLGDGAPSVEALGRRIEAAGFAVSAGPPRSGSGRYVADLTVAPR